MLWFVRRGATNGSFSVSGKGFGATTGAFLSGVLDEENSERKSSSSPPRRVLLLGLSCKRGFLFWESTL